jgi:WD40 repeat protein
MGQENRYGKRWLAYLLPLLTLVVMISQPGIGAQSEMPELPTEPILQIEAGQHNAAVYAIDTDAANQFAVTASYDKSVRVWSLPDGRLIRVLRLPIDYGDIGKAYSVAVSPDGSTIAVGGFTTKESFPENIFLFDRASGTLKQRVSSDLPEVILHLAYSADGRRLAASLGGKKGIRVFDVSDGYRLLPSDTHYEGTARWLTFDRTGRLATASFDGVVRLYAADKYMAPIAKFERKDSRPFSVAFSPDGKRVAVGYADSPVVSVLSASNLTELFKADTAGVPKNYNLNAVEWSQDGRFLYAGGYWAVNNVRQVRRWSNGGRGPFVDIAAASQSIVELQSLKSGSMLVASLRDFGLIGRDASMTRLQNQAGLNLSSGGGHELRVAADGGTVQVDSWEPPHSYRFAFNDRVVRIDPPKDDTLTAPVQKGSGLEITNWSDSTTPAVNGIPIILRDNERALRADLGSC